MLRLRGVVKRYGDRVVLDNVGFGLDMGVVLLVGPNGSGKSTLLRIAAGLLVPDEGEAWCGSRRVYVPESVPRRSFVDALTLCEVIGGCDRERLARFAGVLGVGGLLGRSFRRCSMGEARKLFISSILAAAGEKADCLLVDEPFANLDSFSRRKLWELLLRYRGESGAGVMVLASHVAEGYMVEGATHVAALRDGRLYVKRVDELRREVQRYKFYLGPRSVCSGAEGGGYLAVPAGDYCLVLSEGELGGDYPVYRVDLFSNTDALYTYITSL